jgi:AcrR family transcriptional regulator
MTTSSDPPKQVVNARTTEVERVAARLFRERGYEATSLRQIARLVGVEAPSLYHHFPSKQDLLVTLLTKANEGALRRMQDELQTLERAPASVQLRAAVRGFIGFHEGNMDLASIAETEMRSLEPQNRPQILKIRREVHELVRCILARGVKGDEFEVDDLELATIFILSMAMRVNAWYREDGPLSLKDVAERVSDFSLSALNSSREHRIDQGGADG